MTIETITWIPVSERLPEDDATVLTRYADGTVDAAWYEQDSRRWLPVSRRTSLTHWAAWPKGPKK